MIKFIKACSSSNLFWALLLFLGIGLEASGLYFQYGLKLDPCVNCVYERALFLTFIIAGFIGFIAPSFILTRLLSILIFLSGSIGGIIIAYQHIQDVYFPKLGQSCPLKASFPDFLPLDSLVPWVFSPTGTCSRLDWQFLGLEMPIWIAIIFTCGLLCSFFMLVSEFVKVKNDNIILYK